MLLSSVRADELSTADKLRVVYSGQIAWTRDGLPLVPVRVAEGVDHVRLSAPGLRVLPDGDGGAEVIAGDAVDVRLAGAGRGGRIRWHVVTARLAPGDERLAAVVAEARARGKKTQTLEVGVVLGIRGEILDTRRLLVSVDAVDNEAEARRRATALGADAGVFPERVERPSGVVEASGDGGARVRNDAILWFAAEQPIAVDFGDGKPPRRYGGQIYVTVDGTGRLAVVNAVPEDRLLAGVVPAEMPASAPAEALKAQAVAARTELLARLGSRHPSEPYRLCAAEHCQVYAGVSSEDPRATAAVAATRGELLIRDSGGLVDAVYSAVCGGHGEDNDRAFAGLADPSLRGRFDGEHPGRFRVIDDANLDDFLAARFDADKPACAIAKNFRWTTTLDLPAIEARVGLGPLRDLVVEARGASGRAIKLRVVAARGERTLRSELDIRRTLGGLKSSLFTLSIAKADGRISRVEVRGAGHGHGVGLCQEGARALGESGASYRDILRRYYPASSVRRLY